MTTPPREQILSGAGRAAESITNRTSTSPELEIDPQTPPESIGLNDDNVVRATDQPTAEELEGYEIVKAILGEVADPDKVTIRDAQQYCAILWDDNNRRPLCRLHFNRSQKYVGLFDGTRSNSGALVEARHAIENVDAISNFTSHLQETILRYLEE